MTIERRGRFRIESISPEALDHGYSLKVWHVYDDDDRDPYVGTFSTRQEARCYVKQAILAEQPITAH